MKTKDVSKLDFRKSNVIELNDQQLTDVAGGSSRICSFISGLLADAVIEKLNITVYDAS